MIPTPTAILENWQIHKELWLHPTQELGDDVIDAFSAALDQCTDLPAHQTILQDASRILLWELRVHVARNHNTPIDVLERLSKDKNPYVRKAVAGNIHAPITVLSQLSIDDQIFVRFEVAANPNTPLSILSPFFDDESAYIRRAVVWNRATPNDIILRYLSDQDEIVAKMARYRCLIDQTP